VRFRLKDAIQKKFLLQDEEAGGSCKSTSEAEDVF